MCLMNQKPVDEFYSPCKTCPEYLNSCMPVVIGGYLWGECDQSYCEWCRYYEECYTRNVTSCHSEQNYYESEGIKNYEANELEA